MFKIATKKKNIFHDHCKNNLRRWHWFNLYHIPVQNQTAMHCTGQSANTYLWQLLCTMQCSNFFAVNSFWCMAVWFLLILIHRRGKSVDFTNSWCKNLDTIMSWTDANREGKQCPVSKTASPLSLSLCFSASKEWLIKSRFAEAYCFTPYWSLEHNFPSCREGQGQRRQLIKMANHFISEWLQALSLFFPGPVVLYQWHDKKAWKFWHYRSSAMVR